MEPMLALEPHVIDVIKMDDMICNFMVLLCISIYKGVDKAW